MQMRETILFLSILTSLSACKTTQSGDSSVNEAYSGGFRYEQISVKLLDADGKGLSDIPVVMNSYHWTFEIIDYSGFIPGPGRGWIWKTSEYDSLLGHSNSDGVVEAHNIDIKARGALPGQGPAGFTLVPRFQLNLQCPNSSIHIGAVDIDLKTVSQYPSQDVLQAGLDGDQRHYSDECRMNIASKIDTFKRLTLVCKSSFTSAEIDQKINSVLQNCN